MDPTEGTAPSAAGRGRADPRAWGDGESLSLQITGLFRDQPTMS